MNSQPDPGYSNARRNQAHQRDTRARTQKIEPNFSSTDKRHTQYFSSVYLVNCSRFLRCIIHLW
ncbi:hypothetical protein F7734_43185 [Scytonema sp. UIC 10036]|nr:hypothetical protein [Scytonema sp. UIC 10036]